jgi:CubicO group peptidase (beta-lactamase class C family)
MTDLSALRLQRRVEALLAPWDHEGPGVTIGVVRDGALVLHRSAGLASIELGARIGAETTFRIASVSKQFTCAAILLLAAEGKLRIQDESREFLPELPDLGARITVAHLMHNTSGIRDMLEIMRQGGADLGNVVTAEDLLAGICRQRGLNFAPGSRYLYSNSNFFLLGLIVERLSGQPLPEFLRARIFAPLGMSRTQMTPDTAAPVAGLATGYIPGPDGAWRRARHGFPLGGEGGLVSCVADLALWDQNYLHHAVGGEALAAGLVEQATFTNGTPNGYARGLQIADYRGVRTVSHGGLWPGFKTQFLRAPDTATTVIVITNDGTADPWHLAHDVLDAALEGRATLHPMQALPEASVLERYVGRWIDPERGATVDIRLDERGMPVGSTHGVPFRLRALPDGRLAASRATRDFAARLLDDGGLEVEADAGAMALYRRAPDIAMLPEDLAGRYVSDEMAAAWVFADGAERMTLEVSGPITRGRGWTVLPVDGDLIRVTAARAVFDSWMDTRVLRDGAGRVSGLRVDGGRVRGVVFRRMEGAG